MDLNEAKCKFSRPGDERAVLSYSLKNIDHFYTLCEKLSSDDFLLDDHKLIFATMKELWSKGDISEFDQTMIINKAAKDGILSRIGDVEYIQSIYNMQISKFNFNSYLNNVLEASTKFKLYNSLSSNINEIINSSNSDDIGSEDLLSLVENDVLNISTESKAISEPVNLSDGIDEYLEDRFNNPIVTLGLATGYPILDRQIDGLVPATLTVVSARKKMGKSTLLSNIAANVAYKSHVPVLYIDTEMSFRQWRSRMLAMISNVKERDIIHGNLSDDKRSELLKAAKIIKEGKIFHKYIPGFSVDKISALYKKYKAKENIGLAVFDYIKEPRMNTGVETRRKEYQLLGDLTTQMKDLATILDIPFLAAVQINREGGVAGSDRISWFADVVMEWKRKDKEEAEATAFEGGQYKMIIKDTRRGGMTPDEGICYKFFKQRLRIDEVDEQYQTRSYGNEVVNYGSDDAEDIIDSL